MSWNNSLIFAISLIALTAAITSDATACGPDTDCIIGDRTYRVTLPEGYDGTKSIGAIVFIHGYRGKSAGVMKNTALTTLASELGVVFVAAQAAGVEWNIPGVPSIDALEGVDELAYFDALIEDLAQRFAVDPTRLVVSGFSSGAMMVWHLACYRGSSFAGFVPMSGTFWEPIPEDCSTGSVNLIHYHGKDDTMVPLHGRKIKDGHQGDVYEAIELFARAGGYRPVETEQSAELQCSRQANDNGKLLELCLFPGKHVLKANYVVRAWREFEPTMGR